MIVAILRNSYTDMAKHNLISSYVRLIVAKYVALAFQIQRVVESCSKSPQGISIIEHSATTITNSTLTGASQKYYLYVLVYFLFRLIKSLKRLKKTYL